MTLPIFWNIEAQITFDAIVEYIESVWGEKEVANFFHQTQRVLKSISKQPYIFKASEINQNIRKGLISKQTSLFYQVEKNRIIILYFWDNRQEPIF